MLRSEERQERDLRLGESVGGLSAATIRTSQSTNPMNSRICQIRASNHIFITLATQPEPHIAETLSNTYHSPVQ